MSPLTSMSMQLQMLVSPLASISALLWIPLKLWKWAKEWTCIFLGMVSMESSSLLLLLTMMNGMMALDLLELLGLK